MNILKKQNIRKDELISCIITNYNQNDILHSNLSAYILNAIVNYRDILLSIEDGDYDIILTDINLNDIYLINELRNKFTNGSNSSTKILAHCSLSINQLKKIIAQVPCFTDTVRKVDFFFSTNKNIVIFSVM